MDPTVLMNVAATTVASVIGLLDSATVLLAILEIGEHVAPGNWGGPGGGGGAQFIQPYLTRHPGVMKSAPWAALAKTVLRPATVLLVPAAFLPMALVCVNMVSQATAALSASVQMASMVSAARSPALATQNTV